MEIAPMGLSEEPSNIMELSSPGCFTERAGRTPGLTLELSTLRKREQGGSNRSRHFLQCRQCEGASEFMATMSRGS